VWGPAKAEDKVDELVGKAKQALGKLTDNDADQVEGDDQKFHGQASAQGRDALGNATQVPHQESKEE